jgi:hypothetical protein
VGQQITLSVDLLVPTFFASPPRWPSIDMPGAVITLPEGQELNLTETIGGVSYAGIRQTYHVVAQREGEFALPPARITFTYPPDYGQPPVAGSVTLPPTTFTARLPAGAAAGAPVTVAAITITQSLDREPKGLKVGDALVRTVDVFAEHTQAMRIPPPAFDAPNGVRVYRSAPTLTDETRDRVGFVGGRRVDRVTYVFEKPGDVTLPAIAVHSFDASGKEKTSEAPAIHLSVAVNPASQADIAPETPEPVAAPSPRPNYARRLVAIALAVLAVSIVAWLARRIVPVLTRRVEARRRARDGSEKHSADRVVRACAANDARLAYSAFMRWTAHPAANWSEADRGAPTPLAAELRGLEQALYSSGAVATAWHGRSFAAAFRSARGSSLHAAAHPGHQTALPPLNP